MSTSPGEQTRFGVGAALGEQAQVYYETLFSSLHLGRVSDLLAAQLATRDAAVRAAGVDELALRSALLSVTYRLLKLRSEPTQPISIEVGQDARSVWIAVGSVLEVNGEPSWADRLREALGVTQAQSGSVASSEADWAAQLGQAARELRPHVAELLVKCQPATGRIEWLARVSAVGAETTDKPGAAVPQLIEVPLAATPEAGSGVVHRADDSSSRTKYTALGDLDYGSLLADTNASKRNTVAVAPPEKLTVAPAALAPLEATRVEGGDAQATESVRVRGASALDAGGDTRVHGVTEHRHDDAIHVAGAGGDERSGGTLRVAASAPAPGVDTTPLTLAGHGAELRAYQDRIAELERALAAARVPSGGEGNAGTDLVLASDSASTAPSTGLRGLISRIWPFNRSVSTPVGAASASDATSAPTSVDEPSPSGATDSDSDGAGSVAAATASATGAADPEAAAKSLVLEIQAGRFEQTMARAQREMATLKADLKTAKSKKFVEGFMGDLLAEKARLHDMAKRISASVRQKELEFRNKQLRFEEELRRRDDQAKQQGYALTKSKDQLAQALIQLERAKSTAQSSATDGHLKQKLEHQQRLTQVVKQENIQLATKVEELKGQLGLAQMAGKTTAGVNQTEFKDMKQRYERSIRLTEEHKKQAVELQASLDKLKKDHESAISERDAGKRRIEAAMKVTSSAKKESEKLKLELNERTQELDRLKKELEKLKPPKAA